MAVQYRLVRQNDNLNPEEKKKAGYRPQVVRKDTINLREICKRASEGTTLNAIKVEASLRMVLEHIREELLDSNHVCLDGFGTFSLSAESRLVDSPDNIRAKSVFVKRVVFISSQILMKEIKRAKFIRVK